MFMFGMQESAGGPVIEETQTEHAAKHIDDAWGINDWIVMIHLQNIVCLF